MRILVYIEKLMGKPKENRKCKSYICLPVFDRPLKHLNAFPNLNIFKHGIKTLSSPAEMPR